MRVYAESNFVLELALVQEQQPACDELVKLAEKKELELVLPAFCLFEPFTTLRRRQMDRRELSERVQNELRQIARTQSLTVTASASPLAALLVTSAQEAATRFDSVMGDLLRVARVLPMTAGMLENARGAQVTYKLELPDAIVLASVLDDLTGSPAGSCFLNRNTKDFDDPLIVNALTTQDCKMIGSFSNGLEYVKAQLRAKATPS